MCRLSLTLLTLAALPTAAPGQFGEPSGATEARLHPAATLTAWTFESPRPLRVWVVRIDLTSPAVELVTTPKAPAGSKGHTIAETTPDFAARERADLAINASPFGPIPTKAGVAVTISGLHLVGGEVVAPAGERHAAAVFDARNRGKILSAPVPPETLKGQRIGVGGFGVVLRAGEIVAPEEKRPALHPRTALGLSADNRTMVWIVADGRQKGVSDGLSLRELAALGKRAGCADLINLDGGGSTTLTLRRDGGPPEVVNRPVGRGDEPGTLRLNGNHLGVRLRPAPR